MKRKATTLTPEARRRLWAIEALQSGKSQRDVAQEYRVHQTTIGEWLRLYQEGGPAALNRPMKPRPDTTLDAAALAAALTTAPEKYHVRLRRLIQLAEGKSLRELAKEEGISEQAIMKTRRQWLEGIFSPKNNEE